jgi:ribonuclease Z
MALNLAEKTVGPFLLQGISLAGEETVVTVPEFNVAFDIGRAPREAVQMDTLCLSHGHMDHAAGLAYYFSQRAFQGMPPGTLLVHPKLVPHIEQLLRVWGQIEGHVSPGRIVGVDEGKDFELNRNFAVRPFRVNHPGPTLGFSIVEVRKKLKPEYTDYSGQQIADLKRQGQVVEYRLELPRIAFCGDTALGDFLDHDHVRNAEVLIFECTFFEPDHVERARLGAHTHLCDLPRLMDRVRSPHVLLIHLTRRTGMGDAKRALARLLKPVDLARVSFLMDHPPKRRQASAEPQTQPQTEASPPEANGGAIDAPP